MSWIYAAASLPGKALAVGMAIFFESGCQRNAKTVTVNLSAIGVPRRNAQRALKALVKASLVSVEYRDGRKPLVTILDAPKG